MEQWPGKRSGYQSVAPRGGSRCLGISSHGWFGFVMRVHSGAMVGKYPWLTVVIRERGATVLEATRMGSPGKVLHWSQMSCIALLRWVRIEINVRKGIMWICDVWLWILLHEVSLVEMERTSPESVRWKRSFLSLWLYRRLQALSPSAVIFSH